MTKIKQVQAELAAWSDRQPPGRRAIANRIIGHLDAAQIGARPNSSVIASLIADVVLLERTK